MINSKHWCVKIIMYTYNTNIKQYQLLKSLIKKEDFEIRHKMSGTMVCCMRSQFQISTPNQTSKITLASPF